MSEREGSQRERGATTAVLGRRDEGRAAGRSGPHERARGLAARAGSDDGCWAGGTRAGQPGGAGLMSEREGSQRERGATTAVRPEGRGPDSREERAQRERESSRRERN